MIYPDGSFYIGNWSDNTKSGTGKLVRADQTVYEGQWINDEQHGQGSEKWHDGVFEGQYENGFRHGQGKFEMFDGSSYEAPSLIIKWREKGSTHGPMAAIMSATLKTTRCTDKDSLCMAMVAVTKAVSLMIRKRATESFPGKYISENG